MLYDRPVYALMADAAKELAPPYTSDDVVDWFAQRYPLVKATTVRLHVIGLTANERNRGHHARLASKPPVFYRRVDGTLEPFDPDMHMTGEIESLAAEAADEAEAIAEPSQSAATAEFYLEAAHLEEFLVTNWDLIAWGRRLSIWHSEDGQDGHQFRTPIGRLDFLCVDQDTDALVVVELKRGLPSDRVVGQVARYVSWVRSNLAAPSQPVEAIIVANEADEALHYAVSALPGLSLLRYDVSFALHPIDAPEAP
jgi:hypothetical protein